MIQTNFELEQRIANIVVELEALKIWLVDKGIITKEELEEGEKAVREDSVLTEPLKRIEVGAKVQEILQKETITDEDINWIKENGTKYDTEEDVQKVLEILEWKKDPIFGKLFGAVK